MIETDNIILFLLRCALASGTGSDYFDLSELTSTQWTHLVDSAYEQGVAALTADGYQYYLAEHTGEETMLDSDEMEGLRYEWLGSILMAEEDSKRYNTIIERLSRLYSENGFKPVILKGIGLGLNYPIPAHRPVGDIDLFLLDNKTPIQVNSATRV